MTPREQQLTDSLQYLLDYGCCHDLNPTKRMPCKNRDGTLSWTWDQAEANEQWWHDWIAAMDKHVRDTARVALSTPPLEERTCETCKHEDVGSQDTPCIRCYTDNSRPYPLWQPKPTASEPAPSVEVRCDRCFGRPAGEGAFLGAFPCPNPGCGGHYRRIEKTEPTPPAQAEPPRFQRVDHSLDLISQFLERIAVALERGR